MHGNHGDPAIGAEQCAPSRSTRDPSLTHEEEGGGRRKSEAPIVATIFGNAEGAKGRRFEITDKEINGVRC